MRTTLLLLIMFALMPVSAHAQMPATEDAGGDEKLQAFLGNCRAQYTEVDEKIDKAGVRDAGYTRIPGFPYLRSDRLMAAFRQKLSDQDAFDDWTLQLRDNDAFAREIELINMGMPLSERAQLLTDLRLCAVWMTNIELNDPETLKKLLKAMQAPANAPPHSSTLASALAARQARVKADFSATLTSTSPSVLWQAKPADGEREAPQGFVDALHDHLGRAGLLMGQWPLLAARYAPPLWIETAGEYDRPGTPVLNKDSAAVDTSSPVVFYLPSYTRIQGRVLIQLNYFVWFSARAPLGKNDPDAGPMDGLIWRVTLDEDGEPLVYDSIRASGFDQLWFPLPALKARNAVMKQEGAMAPQKQLPSGAYAVRLRSGSHDIQRIVARGTVQAAETHAYELRSYDDLMTLPLPGGGTRSLFNPQGLIPGTERGEAATDRSSGLPHAGALRQWGQHPDTLLARHYFDDPDLIETLFDTSAVKSADKPTTVVLESVRREPDQRTRR